MRHLAHFKGEFSSWRTDEPRRRRFLSQLMTVIENHVEYTVASAVLMKHYRAMDQKYCLSEFMRPYTFAASTCVSSIIRWAKTTSYAASDVAYHFEKGDVDQADVARCWKSQFNDYRLSPVFLKKTDRHPGSAVCAPIRPFEAADLIAYENFKCNIKREGRQEGAVFLDELRKPLQRLLNLPGAKDWLYSRTSEIEAVCSLYGVAERGSSS
jgi:hypothetical protein